MFSSAMCAVGCRKALELAVKWVYSADKTIDMPYKDNLQSLIHEPTFRFALDDKTWGKLPFIIRLGNLAVHTERAVNKSDALLSLESLFEFIEWVDYCYGEDYVERHFDTALIPDGDILYMRKTAAAWLNIAILRRSNSPYRPKALKGLISQGFIVMKSIVICRCLCFLCSPKKLSEL